MAESTVSSKNGYIFPNLEIREKLEKMLNNVKFSDTVFYVNNSQFHVSSHLVSVSSHALESLIDDHYNNCGDREIKIGNVKQDASFSILLRYLYGLEIAFGGMTRDVLCEVLDLAECYELDNFSKELKSYISRLNCFEIDSTVVLLNTAKKYNLKDLYEELKTFVFDNTDALVKHESFIELKYDVIQDVIKSDWFCTLEIDILKVVLMWHNENLKKESINNAVESVVEKNEKKKKKEDSETDENKEHGVSGISNENLDITKNENCNQLVKTFSENVLKTLLSHIRVKQISMADYLSSFKTELFMNYNLVDHTQFSQNDEPRKKRDKNCEFVNKFIAHENMNKELIFDISCCWLGTMFKSSSVDVHEMKFQLCLKDAICVCKPPSCFDDSANIVDIYLNCSSNIYTNWKCTLDYRLQILQPDMLSYCAFEPEHDDGILCHVNFFSCDTVVKLGCFYYPSLLNDYEEGITQDFEIGLFIKSIKMEEVL